MFKEFLDGKTFYCVDLINKKIFWYIFRWQGAFSKVDPILGGHVITKYDITEDGYLKTVEQGVLNSLEIIKKDDNKISLIKALTKQQLSHLDKLRRNFL